MRQRLLAQVAADRGIGLSETHRDLRIPVRCLHFVDHHAAAHVGDADAGRLELVIERSEEYTPELKSIMPISYAVFCLTQYDNVVCLLIIYLVSVLTSPYSL